MPPLVHRAVPRGRYGRARLDPAAPLFVLRRIPAGVDGAGQPIALAPGESFDASSVSKVRLGTLFRSRFIGHEPPRALRQAPTIAPLADPEPAPVPPQPPVVAPPPVAPPVPAAPVAVVSAPAPEPIAAPVEAPIEPPPAAEPPLEQAPAPAPPATPKPPAPRPFYGKRRGA